MPPITVQSGYLVCRTCKKRKQTAEFCRSTAYKCGYDPRCKACESRRGAVYNARGDVKKRRKAYDKAQRAIPAVRERRESQLRVWIEKNPGWRMCRSARERAQEKGIAFNIEPEDIHIPIRCPLLDVVLTHRRGRKGPSPNSPTLDRIDPTKGYERGNVWVISYRANAIKNDATPEELEQIALRVRQRLRNQE